MSVMERTKEYALMLALGTPIFMLVQVIILEAFLLASVALIFAGLSSLPLHYYLAQYGWVLSAPFDIGGMKFDRIIGEISFITLIFPLLVIMITALLSTLIPIWTACKYSSS